MFRPHDAVVASGQTGEHLQLRESHLAEIDDRLLHFEDARQHLVGGIGDRGVLEPVDGIVHLIQLREVAVDQPVGQGIEKIITAATHYLGHVGLPPVAIEDLGQRAVMNGDEKLLAQDEVDLGSGSLGGLLVEEGGVQNDEFVIWKGLELSSLEVRAHILDRQGSETEDLAGFTARPWSDSPCPARRSCLLVAKPP